MRIVIAGASGLVGGALVPELRAAGHEVVRLVRRAATAPDEIAWDPGAGEPDLTARGGPVDAVVNLAGENIGAGRWTAARRERIFRSRVDATRSVVRAMREASPAPPVLVNASAAGFYGDCGDRIVTERDPIGHGFLPEVCLAWETHAEGARAGGARVVLLRFGVVLAREGGALAKMLPLFRAGLGGRLGSGRQWMSWIGLADAVGVIRFALEQASLAGPVNVVAPHPVTNADFTRELGRALGRPAVLPVPAWALRAAVGRGLADEALLASTRAEPEALRRAGFSFRHPDLAGALQAIF